MKSNRDDDGKTFTLYVFGLSPLELEIVDHL